MAEAVRYGNWACFSPKCVQRYWLPVHVSPQPYIRGREPHRPEFDPVVVSCCGQPFEVTPQNICWVEVEDYQPST